MKKNAKKSVKVTNSKETPQLTEVTTTTNDYQKLVQETGTMLVDYSKSTIKLYWELGKRVHELITNENKYGKGMVNQFAMDLQHYSKMNISTSMLYEADRIYVSLTEDQLKLAQECGISVRGLLQLCRKNVSTDVRTQALLTAKTEFEADRQNVVAANVAKRVLEENGVKKTTSTKDSNKATSAQLPVKSIKDPAKLTHQEVFEILGTVAEYQKASHELLIGVLPKLKEIVKQKNPTLLQNITHSYDHILSYLTNLNQAWLQFREIIVEIVAIKVLKSGSNKDV